MGLTQSWGIASCIAATHPFLPLIGMLGQVPLDRLLLETDAPDGLPRLPEDQSSRLICPVACPATSDDDGSPREELNHPGNIR
jgi:Tat protein secretion system quality control protein TatD with DNase activity